MVKPFIGLKEEEEIHHNFKFSRFHLTAKVHMSSLYPPIHSIVLGSLALITAALLVIHNLQLVVRRLLCHHD